MRIRSLLRRCLRYHTLAAAFVALVLALGGSAYAAITVTGENIVDGSITSADIGPSEVKTTNLAPDGVTTDKLGTAAVTGSQAETARRQPTAASARQAVDQAQRPARGLPDARSD